MVVAVSRTYQSDRQEDVRQGQRIGSIDNKARESIPLYYSLAKSGIVKQFKQFREGSLTIEADVGSRVFSSATGQVMDQGYDKMDGIYVRTGHSGSGMISYSLLQRALVATGQHVEAGQDVGNTGMTGDAYVPALSFEMTKAESLVDAVAAYIILQ